MPCQAKLHHMAASPERLAEGPDSGAMCTSYRSPTTSRESGWFVAALEPCGELGLIDIRPGARLAATRTRSNAVAWLLEQGVRDGCRSHLHLDARAAHQSRDRAAITNMVG